MKKIEALENHTLVIPTFNRSDLLRKLVTYLAGAAPMLHILILDSSAEEHAERNSELVGINPEKLRHIKYPSDCQMAVKISDGLSKVSSSTVSFCADDDVVFPAPLAAALYDLNSNPDIICSHGLYLNFAETGNDIDINIEYSGEGLQYKEPFLRIFHLMQRYESLFYGVFPTEVQKDVFRYVAQIPSLHYQELFQSCAILMLGKTNTLERFYVARRSGPAAEPDREKWQTYYWFAQNPTEFIEDYMLYREKLWEFSCEKNIFPNIEKSEFVRAMDITHATYFSKTFPPEYMFGTLSKMWPNELYVSRDDGLLTKYQSESHFVEFLDKFGRFIISYREKRLERKAHNKYFEINKKIAKNQEVVRNVKFAPKLAWLAFNDSFYERYRDLLKYLDS